MFADFFFMNSLVEQDKFSLIVFKFSGLPIIFIMIYISYSGKINFVKTIQNKNNTKLLSELT